MSSRHLSAFLLAVLLASGTPSSAQDGSIGPEFIARDDGSIVVCTELPDAYAQLGPGAVVERGGERWVVYEDRVSRQPLREALRLSERTRADLTRCDITGVRPERFGMRLPALDAAGSPLAAAPGLGRAAKGVHLDLEVELLYNFAIDYPVDWFRDRIAIGPKVKVWWPGGLVLAAQYAIPVRNQLPEKHAQYWSDPYPNMLMAGFRRQISENWIGAVSGGFYERNRYGGDFQLYWMSDRWPIVIGGRAGMTGYWAMDGGELITGPLDTFTGYLDGTVYLPWYNIRLRGRTGQFIREINQLRRPGEDVKVNPGTSGEITRMFGEIEIGFHAFYDGFLAFPGFRFAAPLSPRRGVKRGRVAVYPTRQHYVPYDLGRVVRGQITGFIRPKRGELQRTEVDIWPDLRWLTPRTTTER
jgi:hypothetical protein